MHLRVGVSDGVNVIVYENVEHLPKDAVADIRQVPVDHPIEKYPEGASIGTIAPPSLESRQLRDPGTILDDTYLSDFPVSELPPEEERFREW